MPKLLQENKVKVLIFFQCWPAQKFQLFINICTHKIGFQNFFAPVLQGYCVFQAELGSNTKNIRFL